MPTDATRFRSVKFSFRPTEGAFYELFTRAAQNLVRGTELLNELGLPGVDVQSVSERLTEVEHDSDQITHELYRKINSTFITPFDREDIYALGSLLDDVMDHLEAVGNLVYLYGLSELPSLPREMHEMVNVLDQQARLTADAMPRLKSMKNLQDYWIECNRLENEGDIAADFLEELLDIADLDGDLDMDVEGNRASVSIVGGDLGMLVGRDGEVLEALQELVRLAVLRETGERSRLMLDVEGFRAKRREELQQIAASAIASVRESGESARLAPMSPFERKVIHDAVADDTDF